jgi:hypothetical protein
LRKREQMGKPSERSSSPLRVVFPS